MPWILIAAFVFLFSGFRANAENKATIDYNNNDEATPEFSFKKVPPPSANDAAGAAQFTLVYGKVDPNGGGIEKLHDGKLPDEGDEPAENFFLQAGTDGGRLLVDLGRAIKVRQVNTYSWHPGTRGPQVYTLYGSDGSNAYFIAAPQKKMSPADCGWKLIANVDTRKASKDAGGQYGASVSGENHELGKYRYLLFDLKASEQDDYFGNTFYSEIDVVDADAPARPEPIATSVGKFTVKTADDKCSIAISTSAAPKLTDWAQAKLAPVLAEWYPKIAAMLPSDGFQPPTHFRITFRPGDGVAATANRNVTANSTWIEKEIGREAVGSIVHEAVHVVQQYGGRGSHNPGWLVEGIADYIRWFKYEPQSHGADLVWMRRQRRPSFRYNEGYRGTANFLNWVTEKYDANIVAEFNAAMREGKYNDELWKKYTGKPLAELGAEWEQDLKAEIAKGDGSAKGS